MPTPNLPERSSEGNRTSFSTDLFSEPSDEYIQQKATKKINNQIRAQLAMGVSLLGMSAAVFYLAHTQAPKYEQGDFTIPSTETNVITNILALTSAFMGFTAIHFAKKEQWEEAMILTFCALMFLGGALSCEAARDEYQKFEDVVEHVDYKTPEINSNYITVASDIVGLAMSIISAKYPLKNAYLLNSQKDELVKKEELRIKIEGKEIARHASKSFDGVVQSPLVSRVSDAGPSFRSSLEMVESGYVESITRE